MEYKDVVLKLKNQRKFLKITQKEFSEKIGLSYKIVQKLERAEYDLSILRFLKICEVLKINPKDVLE